jgi:hypothetical protein
MARGGWWMLHVTGEFATVAPTSGSLPGASDLSKVPLFLEIISVGEN